MSVAALRESWWLLQALAVGHQPQVAKMADRFSRLYRPLAPTHVQLERRIRHLRIKQRLEPVQISGQVHVSPSMVHRVLACPELNRLDNMDLSSEGVIRRYELDEPGELTLVDIKKCALNPQVEGG